MKTNTFKEKLSLIVIKYGVAVIERGTGTPMKEEMDNARQAIIDLVLNDVKLKKMKQKDAPYLSVKVAYGYTKGYNQAIKDVRAIIKGGNHED